jgi:hypothetical protein
MIRCTILILLLASTAAAELDLRNHDGLPAIEVPTAAPWEETVELTEVWRLDCGAEAEVLVGRVSTAAAAPDGRVLLLDRQLGHVLQVDADGAVLRTYGRAGDGPGETDNAFDVCALPDGRVGILEGAPSGTFIFGGTGRLIVLDAQGDPHATIRPAEQATSGEFPTPRGVRVVGDRLLVGYQLTQVAPPRITTVNRVVLCDDEGAVLATLGEWTVESSLEEAVGREVDLFEPYGTGRYDLASDGRVALLPERDAYVVVVRGPDGAGLRLEGTAEARRRSRDEIDALVEENTSGPFTWEACTAEPALAGVRFRPDGRLWVERCPLTTDPETGDFGTYDEFDREGALLRRVRLHAPGDPASDRLVALADGRFILIRNHHVDEESEEADVELEVVLLRPEEAP